MSGTGEADRVLPALLALALALGGLLGVALVAAAASVRGPGDLQATVRRSAGARLAELGLDGRRRSMITLDRRGTR